MRQLMITPALTPTLSPEERESVTTGWATSLIPVAVSAPVKDLFHLFCILA